MSTIREVVDVLITGARSFVTTSMFRDTCDGCLMNKDVNQAFLETYLDTIDEKFDEGEQQALRKYIKEYAPTSEMSIFKNRHMNKANGNSRTAENMLAVLVDFINFAAVPLDLALYTSDIELPWWASENQTPAAPATKGPKLVDLEADDEEDPPYQQQIHERAWFEVASRLAGTKPPFVPVNGHSVNLYPSDMMDLTTFFLADTAMSWATGIGSIEACDAMVREAEANGNFNGAYAYWSATKLTKAEQKRAKKVVPAYGAEFEVRGHLKVRKPDPDCKECGGSGIVREPSARYPSDTDDYPCRCITFR